MSRLALLLLLIQIWPAHSWQPRFHLGRAMFGMQNYHERFSMRKPEEDMSLPKGSGAKTDYFIQRLDHFDKSSTATWRQRFHHNFQHTNGSSNIKAVFLMVGGEGPLRLSTVNNDATPFMMWAKRYGAAVFALEHRFYGESHPTPNQSVKNLQYLSSRQALEDIANFIRKMNVEYKLGKAKWIAFGGSYPGALSLWARQIYPDLIAGAVGSSAPLDAEIDFWGYLEVVENALREYSQSCAENVRKGFAKMTELMKTKDGRDHLTKVFVLKAPLRNLSLSYNDIQYFYMVIYENFQMATQYNRVNVIPFKNAYGIEDVCKIMIKEGNDPLAGLQKVNAYMAQLNGMFVSTDNSYDSMIQYLRREQFENSPFFDSGARSWTWQTCTEFGYYQTTDGGPKGIFGDVTPLSVFINMCTDVFGPKFDTDYIGAAVRSSQSHYGGVDGYKGTNVVIPNGSIDPWHRLGKFTSNDKSVVWYLINGTAHCAEMSPPSPDDKPGLTEVRKIIQQNLETWLKKTSSRSVTNSKEEWVLPKARTIFPEEQSETDEKLVLLSQMKFPKWTRYRKMYFGRPPEGFVSPPKINYGGKHVFAAQPLFITQPFDHFNDRDNRTFRQKYYKNSKYAKPSGPMFLIIGGESPEGPEWVDGFSMFHVKLAEKLNATVFVLEHRYYGDSIVGGTGKDANPDLTYLSSLQMLHDVANFIRTMNAKMNSTAKWVTFGGSYSGSLSLWMRELFPDLVIGAVGSSAPLEAKLDFYEYLRVVERSYRKYQPECADYIGKGFDEIHKLVLTKSGRKNLSDTFTLVPPWNENSTVSDVDVEFFFQNLIVPYLAMVQDDHRDEVCMVMANKSRTHLENMAFFNERIIEYWQQNRFNGTENSVIDYIAFLKHAQRYGPWAASMRLWIWQTCTEFGFYQSTDSGYSIFGSPTPLNFYTYTCAEVFGKQFTAAVIQKNVRRTNKIYGGTDNYKGKNAVILNGNIDPWHALGLYKSNDPTVVTVLLNGTSHCADMFYPLNSEIRRAQAIVEQNVRKWVKEPASTSTTQRATTRTSSRSAKPTSSTTKFVPTTTSKIAYCQGCVFAILYSLLVKFFWLF